MKGYREKRHNISCCIPGHKWYDAYECECRPEYPYESAGLEENDKDFNIVAVPAPARGNAAVAIGFK